ncbi:MAG: sigma-54 dependent transcriptional regulator [Candidatus Sumerlaeota bacterium]|nr:sigma-54 dependent transcriptional regulator [Candidatus Sumerlaeota bacterium]
MSTPSRQLQVVIADDDAGLRVLMRHALERSGYQVTEARDGQEAVELAEARPPDAMILDVRMPRMTGLEALELVRARRPEIAILLLTAYIDVRDAVSAIKKGARDYLEKPIDLDELVVAVDEALGVSRATSGREDEEAIKLPAGIVAESAAMRRVFQEALKAAPTNVTTLLLGESGTGKEVVARFIHDRSERRAGAFVAVNCAALPEALIESELFGHERGAFTGAVASKPGRFEEASGGTLLLDEIGEMPLSLQPKLLRILEEKKARRVGGSKEIEVDARVIAATNRPLEEEARAGRFREDLLFRLNVFAIRVPALRERREDILPLARHFLTEQTAAAGASGRDKHFAPATLRLLSGYEWPGNVRELRNAVTRAFIISRGSLILPEDLPETLRRRAPVSAIEASQQAAQSGPGQMAPAVIPEGGLEAIERQAILDALNQTGGNKTQAACLLGVSRRNLIYKLRSYGM